LMTSILVAMLSLTCTAAALSASTLAGHSTGLHLTLPTPRQRSQCEQPRCVQLSMQFGYRSEENDDEYWWHNGGRYNAMDRAQQRAMRRSGSFAGPMARPMDDDSQPPWARNQPHMVNGLEGWVMIFNAGQHNEGVYTQNQDGGRTTILAFESLEDAEHYSQILLSQGFDLATPFYWGVGELRTFCRRGGYKVSVMPHGTLPAPPEEYRHHDHHHGPVDGNRRGGPARGGDSHESYCMWLEDLLHSPSNCDDDDCLLR